MKNKIPILLKILIYAMSLILERIDKRIKDQVTEEANNIDSELSEKFSHHKGVLLLLLKEKL